MQTGVQAAPVSKKRLWTGYILTALPVLMLLFSAALKLAKLPAVVQEFARLGFAESLIVPIGILEAACAIVYAIPRTAMLGAVLVAAYLGGATVTHVRVGDPFIGPVVLGMMAWLGLWLREPGLRELAPTRK
jgi:DoxX-like family